MGWGMGKACVEEGWWWWGVVLVGGCAGCVKCCGGACYGACRKVIELCTFGAGSIGSEVWVQQQRFLQLLRMRPTGIAQLAAQLVLLSSKTDNAWTHLGHQFADSRRILHPRSPQPVPRAMAAAIPCSCCCFDLNCSTARQLRLRVTQGMIEQHVVLTGMRATPDEALCFVGRGLLEGWRLQV